MSLLLNGGYGFDVIDHALQKFPYMVNAGSSLLKARRTLVPGPRNGGYDDDDDDDDGGCGGFSGGNDDDEEDEDDDSDDADDDEDGGAMVITTTATMMIMMMMFKSYMKFFLFKLINIFGNYSSTMPVLTD
ncbi:hypothetical protein ElyMa_006025400 [Elysia marginata]|uniref:Uncharacterized protein n=1 Tax=Elysia marginata TaxID=1093978 RepID=A0AAV4GJU4_9GAST|nr:hypothetical protein ElyMa_006025400 [Elysia marginata]